MSTRRIFANHFLVALGLLGIASVSLADPCDDIKSSNSTGTYSVYYPSYATTCVWTYNPVVSRGGTTIDMYGTVTNGHITSTKNSLDGVSLDAKGKVSKNALSNNNTCANGAVIEFLGSCSAGNLHLTLLQTNDPATGSVLGDLLIGSGSFSAGGGSTFNFRVTANQ